MVVECFRTNMVGTLVIQCQNNLFNDILIKIQPKLNQR